MGLIISSSVQITGRANLPINTLIHFTAMSTLFYTVGQRRLVCCICVAYASLLAIVRDWEALIRCTCVKLSTVSECVCVVTFNCYYFHVCFWWVIAHRAYGCLYVLHMYLVSKVCVCVCVLSLTWRLRVNVCVKAFTSVRSPFIFLSGWLNPHMPVVWLSAVVRGRVSSLRTCVCVFLCFGSGSTCVRVRGEVSLGWPWLESWKRAEVKEEICRKDTHHFPH